MRIHCFRCVSTVRLGAETVLAGGAFQAAMSDYVRALVDNGLVVAVDVDSQGRVNDMEIEPPRQSVIYGVVAMSC